MNCNNCIHKLVCKNYPGEGIPPATRERMLNKGCEHYGDVTKMIELPVILEGVRMKRLTTDEPSGNFDGLMNFCYDKDKTAVLRWADGEDDIELAEYTARCCKERGCKMDAQEIKADIMDCDCPVAAMYCLGVQAVEMRGRLKHYEDLEEQGRLVELPCRFGDQLYSIRTRYDSAKKMIGKALTVNARNLGFVIAHYGTTLFTKQEAEAALEKMNN